MFFRILITAHNLLRWVVLLAAIWALLRAYLGWLGRRPYTPMDKQSGIFFSIFLDLQVTLGIILAILSPYVRLAAANFGNALQDESLRFILVQHIPLMLIAVAIVHMVSSWSKKAVEDLAWLHACRRNHYFRYSLVAAPAAAGLICKFGRSSARQSRLTCPSISSSRLKFATATSMPSIM
jgi:hypothetical protein